MAYITQIFNINQSICVIFVDIVDKLLRKYVIFCHFLAFIVYFIKNQYNIYLTRRFQNGLQNENSPIRIFK